MGELKIDNTDGDDREMRSRLSFTGKIQLV